MKERMEGRKARKKEKREKYKLRERERRGSNYQCFYHQFSI